MVDSTGTDEYAIMKQKALSISLKSGNSVAKNKDWQALLRAAVGAERLNWKLKR